ncbi:MAG: transglutaminase-like domain-containing protein [Firmicutes bacterium]|nr:transglutaminase-like domain-containing protein [Bacillota bacterium]
MTEELKRHYLTTGVYTHAGPYDDYFRSLPDDIAELGRLICSQVIHRVTLKQGNTKANESLLYGDMSLFPWYRPRCEDDIFLTATAMASELFRLDDSGFTFDRKVENKLVVTCRYVSVLMSSILKAKGIPSRSRSGFAPYFDENQRGDHWINQYWDDSRSDWVSFDADGFFDGAVLGFDPYDIPSDKFDWAAETWLNIRRNKVNGEKFVYAGGVKSLEAAIRAVFYDFHSLMNNEISYKFQPAYIDGKFDRLTASDLTEIDHLAGLLLEPDKNFAAISDLWANCRKFRILNSPLVGDWDNE